MYDFTFLYFTSIKSLLLFQVYRHFVFIWSHDFFVFVLNLHIGDKSNSSPFLVPFLFFFYFYTFIFYIDLNSPLETCTIKINHKLFFEQYSGFSEYFQTDLCRLLCCMVKRLALMVICFFVWIRECAYYLLCLVKKLVIQNSIQTVHIMH